MEPSTILDPSQVIELRQYTLHPGKRDALVELFDRCFIESQEALGMRVLGQFRDLDAPDRFVWLRGFADLPSRAAPLDAFYTGPVWKQHREAANATMIDSDDVLLLRPVDAGAGFALPRARPADAAAPSDARAAGAPAPSTDSGAFVVATIYLLRSPVDDAFVRWFDGHVAPVMAQTGAPPLARLRTEYGENNYPRLPVREGEHAFVWFTSFASAAHHERHRGELARSAPWTRHLEPELVGRCVSRPHQLRLAPTARSLLRHCEPHGFTLHRRGDVHDFDFLAGDWNVAHRRLKVRGAGCTEWDEFPSTSRARLHLGGVANVDELTVPTRTCAGMTVRYFRLADQQWTIRWISARTGDIDPGVVGGFQGDRGEFYGHELDGERLVKVRFIWNRLGPSPEGPPPEEISIVATQPTAMRSKVVGPDAARWEQSFSYDDGPWEVNWVMEFTRAK
jgi:hypothetical protein